METKGWDVFRSLPPETDSSSENIQKWLKNAVKILKVVAYLFTFCMVLVCSVVTKGTTLFMTSQLKLHRTVEYCNHELERGKEYVAKIATQERVAWTWCIFFAFIIPELGKIDKFSTTLCKQKPLYCSHLDVFRNCIQISENLCFQIMSKIFVFRLFCCLCVRDNAHCRADADVLRCLARAGRGEGRHAHQLCVLHPSSAM